MECIRLSIPDPVLRGTINLPLSKSESNRLLIIRALCQDEFDLGDVSDAVDTTSLQAILKQVESSSSDGQTFDAGPAGTTARFLTAYFSALPGTRILTGSARMQKRPIGVLVQALRALGAKIDYLNEEGFLPLRIEGGLLRGGEIEVEGNISSQFISALLLIAPAMHNGLVIRFVTEIVSRPYINMTIRIMERFGVSPVWDGNVLSVSQQAYRSGEEGGRVMAVEPDWSAASYWFSMAALAREVDLFFPGLREDSLQGDLVTAHLYDFFGVHAHFENNGLRLRKTHYRPRQFAFNFDDCPDIVQTVAVTASALQIPTLFTGLNTLRIKETDRVAALIAELSKLGVVAKEPVAGTLELVGFDGSKGSPFVVHTYEDHRMAMAFAPLALLGPIVIEDPSVVEKSYLHFWDDLRAVGFQTEAC